MTGRITTRTKVVGLALAAILGTSMGAIVAGILPTEPQASERGMQAWSDRLTQQAEAYRQNRINEAWTLRLTGIVRQRADDAWTDRLTGIADELGARGMSERATQAWTDRLNGLADAYAASH